MYKYQVIGKEIIAILKQRKKEGEKTTVLTAREVEELLNVSERCGAKPHSRYPLICQAMEYASGKYQGAWIDGKNPSSTFTVEYKLSIF